MQWGTLLDTLRDMKAGVVSEVRRARSSRLSHTTQLRLLESGDKPTLRALASNPILAPDLQVRLASRGEVWSRIALASNSGLCLEAERVLLGTTIRQVHRGLAINPALSVEGQARLAQSSDAYVRILLVNHPSLDVEAQTILAQKACPVTAHSFIRFLSATSLHLPVWIYEVATDGRSLLEEACRAAGASSESFWSLANNWRGSVATLIEATFLVESSPV